MEAPLQCGLLRVIVEFFFLKKRIFFFFFMDFLPFPASFIESPKKTPFPISRRRQLCQVRDCGVFTTFIFFAIACFCLFKILQLCVCSLSRVLCAACAYE
ncbi:hypothetical protein F4809DRAFT_591633 [Biscogniauxia mediterranea]|nr:hypothetical protein F4809DRAFT_591633 [Biscogniauxia mediterranea]